MPRYLNDGSGDKPKLLIYLNLANLDDLRPGTLWPGLKGDKSLARLRADGFDGVQVTDGVPPSAGLMPYCGLDRINTVGEALPVAQRHADRGDQCLTVHVGWGIEDDKEVFRLVEAILAASEKTRLPIFIETHRATITQDMWRTVQITRKFPEVLFNGDFSHYYCGQEMSYGGLEMKMEFMTPIFDRVGFLHGRIASPGQMQMPVDDVSSRPFAASGGTDYFYDFRLMWTRAMRGFLHHAQAGDILIFSPELLSGRSYYARLFPNQAGKLVEETDRYQQALLYRDIAKACFNQAQLQ